MTRNKYDEAVQWFLLLNDEYVSSNTRAQFAEWLLTSPEHIRVFLDVSQAYEGVGSAARDLNVKDLVGAARQHHEKSNVVFIHDAQSSAEPEKTQRGYRRFWCLIASAVAVVATVFATASALTRPRWLCGSEVNATHDPETRGPLPQAHHSQPSKDVLAPEADTAPPERYSSSTHRAWHKRS